MMNNRLGTKEKEMSISIDSHASTDALALEVTNVSKAYGDISVLENFSLEVFEGEFVSLLGPSGCGKSTSLNIVSGFASPDTGSIRVNGKDVTSTPPFKRNSAVVFQDYALFPHLTVEDNVSYGLRAQKTPKSELKERLDWALGVTAIEPLRKRYPSQLSGGQQQRVAVARALVLRPAILLMDEPLSNLDAKLRAELRVELKALQRETGQSVLFVTHDQVEALSMSDRIVVMNQGRIEQVGSPADVYEKPVTRFVASFMGVENIFEIHPQGDDYVTSTGLTFNRDSIPSSFRSETPVALGIRPSTIRITAENESLELTWAARAKVLTATYLGDAMRYELEVQSQTVVAVDTRMQRPIASGAEIDIHVHHRDLLWLTA